MASKADEVEALASQLDGAQIADGMDDYDQDRCIAALREYADLLREDRCAPLVHALERIADHDISCQTCLDIKAIARRALDLESEAP